MTLRLRALAAALAAALALPTALAAVQSGPSTQAAQALLQQGDLDGATRMLRTLTSERPDDGIAWSMLGFALRGLGDYDAAVGAYEHAVKLRPRAAGPRMTGALTLAQSGDVERAFAWLMEAKAMGTVDLTGVDADPAAALLRDDPRYASIFPAEAELADPFVEPVEIIHEWRAEAAGDQFGWIARNVGDVDGDGVNDVTTSAPTHAAGGPAAGRVYVYSGRSGALLWAADGDAGDQLGLGIEAAGDVDGDGIPDVIAGAPGGDEAVVYSGSDGRVIHRFAARQPGEQFGRKVSDLGDVDGDGHDDVFVGAPLNDVAGQDAGRAYVLSGRDGSTLFTLTGEEAGDNFGSSAGGVVERGSVLLVVGAPNAGQGDRGRAYVYRGLSAEPAFVVESDPEGAQLGGMFVSAVGDVDGDGTVDVYAADWNGNGADGLPGAGRVYVHSGATGKRLHTLVGEARGDGFGIGVADAGDVDGDGHDDLVIGAWQHASAAPSGGKVYLFSGRDGTLLRAMTGKVMGETFGFDATGMGDVNGDGVIDLLLTSAWSAVKGGRAGRMYIVSGDSGR